MKLKTSCTKFVLAALIICLSFPAAFAQFTQKIYFTQDWKPTYDSSVAMYYRIVKLDNSGKLINPVKDYYRNGQLQMVGNMVFAQPGNFTEGLKNGPVVFYHENGKKSAEANYVNNVLNGMHKVYNKKGTLTIEETYKSGVVDGPITEYHDNGMLFRKYTYKNGVIDGEEAFYNTQGKVSARNKYNKGKAVGGCYTFNDYNSDTLYRTCLVEYNDISSSVSTWRKKTFGDNFTVDTLGVLTLPAKKGNYSLLYRDGYTGREDNFAMTVNIKFNDKNVSKGIAGGFAYNIEDDRNFMVMAVGDDGYFTLYSMINGVLSEESGTAYKLDNLVPGAVVKLGAVAYGDQIEFIVNDQNITYDIDFDKNKKIGLFTAKNRNNLFGNISFTEYVK